MFKDICFIYLNLILFGSLAELNRTFPGLFPTLENYQQQTGLLVMSTNTCADVFKGRSPREVPHTDTVSDWVRRRG
ncbi:hypothetical protein DPMN_013849 [Dreissena polymorpha]|uniref:Uncharacterized protein n=1 Tax=Dreissena polymorpha TaxID=45954 RepID=A0A9D4S2W9_DREPO|nr:hypothetical protein DPMN_013849 [Dreissena polymorpha]